MNVRRSGAPEEKHKNILTTTPNKRIPLQFGVYAHPYQRRDEIPDAGTAVDKARYELKNLPAWDFKKVKPKSDNKR